MNNFESSWYVENLLINSSDIKERIGKSISGADLYDEFSDDGFDDVVVIEKVDSFLEDSYDDLLDVETAISNLIKKNLIPRGELKVINLILDNNNFADIHNKKLMTRFTASKTFKRFCARVAYYLGGKFTNSGYVDYMKNKYELSQEEILKLEEHIVSNRRYI